MRNNNVLSTIQSGHSLTKTRLTSVLAELAGIPRVIASSVYARAGEVQGFLAGKGLEGRAWWEVLSRLERSTLGSATGIVALRIDNDAVVIVPPFPILENSLAPDWDVAPLTKLLETDYTVGVVLLRLGRYSVAVYEGERLLSSKTDTRYVMARHHAGGTSQKRFQRVREGQVHRLYSNACATVQSQFSPYSRQINYVLLGGDKFTLEGFLRACPYLEKFRSITLDRRLNIRSPRHDALQEVAVKLKDSRVYAIRLESWPPAGESSR